MTEAYCCTCANPLSTSPPSYGGQDEKPGPGQRSLDCCGRIICGKCVKNNPRFEKYCPYCQISNETSSIPSHGLREPPAYSRQDIQSVHDQPPAYSDANQTPASKEKAAAPVEDVLHYVKPTNDSIASLSLNYGVPQDALRRKNNLFADHLLAARKSILIPGDIYKGGVSLSPEPIESEEEELRKSKIRKWMVTTKNADYEMALLYLSQAQYDLGSAIEAFLADEQWEKANPIAGRSGTKNPKRKKLGFAAGLTSQLS